MLCLRPPPRAGQGWSLVITLPVEQAQVHAVSRGRENAVPTAAAALGAGLEPCPRPTMPLE